MAFSKQLAFSTPLSLPVHRHLISFVRRSTSCTCVHDQELRKHQERTNNDRHNNKNTSTCLSATGTVTNAYKLHQGNLNKQQRQQEQVRSRRPRRRHFRNNHESIYSRAKELLRLGDTANAHRLLHRGTRDNPRDGRNWVALGRLEAALGKAAQARSVFRRGHRVLPKNVFILHAWARVEANAKHVEEARNLLEKAIEIDCGDVMLYQEYAMIEGSEGDIAKARLLFEKGCRAARKNASIRNAWGVLEMKEGCLEKAVELFEEALRCNSRHIRSFQSWAIAETRRGNFEKAESLYKEALRLDPRSAPTLQAYALLCKESGRVDEARALFKKGLSYRADDVSILHAWAKLEHEEGNCALARDLYNRGLNASPQSTAVLRAWASMELDLGHIDKSSDWQVPRGVAAVHGSSASESNSQQSAKGTEAPNYRKKQITAVSENLVMLRRLIERRSEEDVRMVLQWLAKRAEKDSALRVQVTKRSGEDTGRVLAWAERRSKEDIAKFDQWVASRYEQDRQIGVYLFNMNIPETPPKEWFRLSKAPEKRLQQIDESIYTRDQVIDYADFVYWIGGFAKGLANGAALTAALCVMSVALIGANAQLEHQGYSSTMSATAVKAATVAPPSGVDAHLIQQEFEANEFLNL